MMTDDNHTIYALHPNDIIFVIKLNIAIHIS